MGNSKAQQQNRKIQYIGFVILVDEPSSWHPLREEQARTAAPSQGGNLRNSNSRDNEEK